MTTKIKDIIQLYNTELNVSFDELRKYRKKLIPFYVVIGVYVISFALFVIFPEISLSYAKYLYPLISSTPYLDIFLMGILAILLIYSIYMAYSLSKKIEDKFKKEIVVRVLKVIDPELKYNRYSFIPQGTFQSSKLFNDDIDRYRGEDLCSGVHGETKFQFSEIHAEEKVRRDKKTRWETIFKGLFLEADFNKHLSAHTLVVPDIAEKFGGKLVGRFLQKMNLARIGDLVQLENPVFEKEYACYSTDGQEARYILTPDIMEKMLKIRKKYGPVFFAFKDNHVYVAHPNRVGIFDSSLLKHRDLKALSELYEEIQMIFDIIDFLNLNTRIWTKK